MNMKKRINKSKVVAAIVCGILASIICVSVCIQWHAQGCGFWSLFAAVAFYTVGCWGLYIFISEIIDWVQYWFGNGDIEYKGRK